jgi:pilus assembly protein CpaC
MATIPNAKTSIVGDKVIVEGNALSDEDRDKVAELAKRYPQIVNFTSAIGWEKMVMMDVKVVEFPKSELRDIGLKWTANGGAAVGAIWQPIRRGHDGPYSLGIPANGSGLPISDAPPPGAGAGTSNGTATMPTSLNVLGGLNMGLSAQLNLLEQQGTASVLAEPQLSARSGFKASFLAGGEFPYSVSNQNGVTILFKQYGIKLDIEPRVGRDGIIRAIIESEVSSLDASVSTLAGPALLTRRTKTEFNTRDGETMVLAGLLQRNISNDVDKVPFLGSLPVLGPLFRSKRYQNRETELVVFVTPTVVDSRSPGLVDRVEKTTERLSERLDRSPYLSDPLQPAGDSNRPGRTPPAPAQQPPRTTQ